MAEEANDGLDMLDDIDLSEGSSSINLVGDGGKDDDVVDLGDINDLMKEDDDEDMGDLGEIDSLLDMTKDTTAKKGDPESSDNFSELEEPKPKEKKAAEELKIDTSKQKDEERPHTRGYISNSPTSLTYKAEGKSWVEVQEESSDSSVVKIEKPNEADVQSLDSSSPTKSIENPKSAESSPELPEPSKEGKPISLNLEKEQEKETASKEEPPIVNTEKDKVEEKSCEDTHSLSEDITKIDDTLILQVQTLSSEKLSLEQELRRIKTENEILQTRLTNASRALKTRDTSTTDLVKQISKLTREKKAYEDQVRFWRNKANQAEKEVTDSMQEKQDQLQQELEMSNKKLKLIKSGHKRKTTEMEIQMRRMEEKQTAMKEEHELPTEVTELHALTLNLKIELRMKDAEMKVLNERLREYKSQIQFKDVAEDLQQQMREMENEVALVHESKKQIIRTLTSEIDELQSTVLAYINRPSTEDLRAGIIKGYHFSRTTANKVYTKLFAPPPSPTHREDRDSLSKSWG